MSSIDATYASCVSVRRRRHPHLQVARRHRLERVDRPMPGVGRDLLPDQRRLRRPPAPPQRRSACRTGVGGPRRHPSRQRDEQIGAKPQVESLDDRWPSRRRAEQALRARPPRSAQPRWSASRMPTSSNASRIAAMYAPSASTGGRSPPSATAAASGEITLRAWTARIEIRLVDSPTREHLDVRREGHRRRPVRQQRLEAIAPGSQQDDGRGRSWAPTRSRGRTGAELSMSAAVVVTGSWQTKSRQT